MVKEIGKIQKPKFSLKKRWLSIGVAARGFGNFLTTEHNAILHLAATVLVVFLAILFHISRLEIILLTIVTGLVWTAELFNTAIERVMDFISIERMPQIKFIKDLSAAAVLLATAVAIITGCLIFISKMKT